MDKIKRFIFKWNSEVFLFIFLSIFVLSCSSLKVSMAYGITFSFTSIFLFLMLRLFGLKKALAVGLLTFLFIPHTFTVMSHHFLMLVECLFVGAFFCKGRKAKMFLVDLLFWLTIGITGLYFMSHLYLTGIPLVFQICTAVVNGLFNVLIADMLLAYVPFYKLIKHNRISKNSLSIHQFLFHITVISIIVPFFLSVLTNTWNAQKSLEDRDAHQAKTAITRLESELLKWNRHDWQQLHAQNDVQLAKLDELVTLFQSPELNILIVGENDFVYASTSEMVPSRMVFDFAILESGKKTAQGYHVVLPKDESGPPIYKWGKGHYVFMNEEKTRPLKIVAELPVAQYQQVIFNSFLEQLGYSLIFALLIITLVQAVSRIFLDNIKQLTFVSTRLPEKLVQLENIEWPKSYVSDLRMLTHNLKRMAEKLKELFQESIEMNQTLRKQTKRLVESEERLHQLAFYDELTELPNRRHFQLYVEELVNTQASLRFAVIFIDVNQFKQVNDTLGHSAGDHLLIMVAERLRKQQAEDLRIFRLGGDEFVFVQSYEDKEKIEVTLREMRDYFMRPFSIHGHSLYVTASVGISTYPEDGSDIDSLVKCADIAMYQSKENGGTTAYYFTESMKSKYEDRLLIENSLRSAIQMERLELYYQPKYFNGKISSMEALVRWNDPVLGYVSPAVFIPIAEEIGIISKLDSWSLKEACRQNKQWQDRGFHSVPIAVNVSAKHFQQEYVVSMVNEALEQSGLSPRYLKLEITESVFIRNLDEVAKIIKQLRAMGVCISIDDFGKGYSSLYPLLQLPIDEIKIDRQFITDIDQDERKFHLVQSLLNMAYGLHLNVVAEGIETVNEKEALLKLGCNELQGYLFSRPLPPGEMEELLK